MDTEVVATIFTPGIVNELQVRLLGGQLLLQEAIDSRENINSFKAK